MAGAYTQAGAQRALNAALGIAAPAAPLGGWGNFMYVGLATAIVTPTGTPTEYTATGYARQLAGMGAPSAGNPSVSSNGGTITFGPLTGANGTTSIGWCFLSQRSSSTSETAADIWAAWTLTTARQPAAGDSAQFAATGLSLSQSQTEA